MGSGLSTERAALVERQQSAAAGGADILVVDFAARILVGFFRLAPIVVYLALVDFFGLALGVFFSRLALVLFLGTARLFGSNTKWWLARLYGGALILMAIAFALARVPLPGLAGLVAAGVHMARQIRTLDIDDPDQCLRLFKSNSTVGWLIFIGLLAGGLWASFAPLV